MLDQAFIAEMKEKLLAEKKEIEEKLAEITAPETGFDNPDMDDTSNDARQDIFEDSLEETYKATLEKVVAALDRIEKGTYGKCVNTGEEIAKERLEVEPWADKCVK